MSHAELDRLTVIKQIIDKRLKQVDAARLLGLSTRQVKRLVKRYRQQGHEGLISKHRGKSPNNALPAALQKEVIRLIRDHYQDFSPTFAHEKLTTMHGYQFSVETLRQWMMAHGLWKDKRRKQARIHQRRPRRPCLGELIQIDGSPHDWFEGRCPPCTLLVFIDDATSRLMALFFAPAETTQAYMQTLHDYLLRHGRPVAVYSDKHSIFRHNQAGRDGQITQFSRALKTLDIEPIHANTPQAKGRVERANQTLQDRLVKEMRLQGINSIEAANAFLPSFVEAYNARFAVAPLQPDNAHRPVLHSDEELWQIFSLHHTRKLSKNLSFQFRNRVYQLLDTHKGYRLRGASIALCEHFDDSLTLLYQGQTLPWRILAEGEPVIPLDDEKSLQHTVTTAKEKQLKNPNKAPRPDHPWRKMIRRDATNAAL